MIADANVLAFVLAGGKGTRLYPLTAEQPKPAIEFADGVRIVDFVLSNLVLSQIASIFVLAQYKPRVLVEHVEQAWARAPKCQSPVITMVVPKDDRDDVAFRGTADAVRKNLDVLRTRRPDIVAVFAADHVYRMDVRQMVRFHELHDADVTVATLPVPLAEASSFGIVCADEDGAIEQFQEKPQRPAPMPANPTHALASMGNYLFRRDVLIDLLEDAVAGERLDFGTDILPALPGRCRAFAYDFSTNTVPGIKAHEERVYWRDVGTREALEAARRDIRGPRPRFDLYNPAWPIGQDGVRRRNAAADPPPVPLPERHLPVIVNAVYHATGKESGACAPASRTCGSEGIRAS